MTSPNEFFEGGNPIPKLNIAALKRCLKEGLITAKKAATGIGLVYSDGMITISEHADETFQNLGNAVGKNEKLEKEKDDLTEKFQGLTQALLYKEEKLDEKCREVARYKAICEMSARAAFGDGQYYDEDINNNVDHNEIYGSPDRKGRFIKEEPRRVGEADRQAQNLKSHTKLSQNQMHLSQYVAPLRPSSCKSNPSDVTLNDYEGDEQSGLLQYYAGGPCKRKIPILNRPTAGNLDSKIRERMELIGGINVRGPKISTGSVGLDRLVSRQASNSRAEQSNKRIRIDLTSQRNEVMSSSGILANQMRSRIVEKDLHKQVAGGCFTRLASRRKKDWPF